MLVYLADLRYTTISVSPDTMPLGIGFLASYASKILGKDVEFKLFAYPEQLISALNKVRPDVLGVTNYCWSYSLSSRMIEYARKLHPDILTIMGGPNIALDKQGRIDRFNNTNGLDIYLIDEGEEAFANLLERFVDSNLQKQMLFKDPLASSVFKDLDSKEYVFGSPALRRTDLNDIPSPYLSGLMDEFFDGTLCPLIQTSRGCPFTCTFCVEGVNYMTKVNRFSLDRVKEELEYIAPHAGVGSALMISDSNFGMLPGDLEIATAIHEAQQEYSWPKYIWATTGKNNKDSILAAIDVLEGSMRMTNSVQSMTPEVLTNIKRSNIKLETYSGLQKEVQARGRQSYAEVIIGLPGETLKSFLQGICQLLDAGAQQVSCYQLMLLDGTELNNQSTREKYDFKTKFRILPRSFGIYDARPVFEVEEVVVETNTLSFDEYLECRKLQLILDIFHREGLFQEILAYLNIHNVQVSEFILDLLANIHSAPSEFQVLLSQYLDEARNELFDSPEQAREILSANYDMVLDNEIGGNLVFKYSAIGWFANLDSVLTYGIERAKVLINSQCNPSLSNRKYEIDSELETIKKYHISKTINLVNIDEALQDVVTNLDYDIESWKGDGYTHSLSEYSYSEGVSKANLPAGKQHIFYITKEHSHYLLEKLNMHGTSNQAIGKLLSRLVLRDLQREVKLSSV